MRDLWKRAFGAIALLLVVLLALAPGGTQTSVSGSDQAAGRAPQAGGQLLASSYQEGGDPGASPAIASEPVAPVLTQAVRDLPLYVAEYTLNDCRQEDQAGQAEGRQRDAAENAHRVVV